jgi:hypothetical protein
MKTTLNKIKAFKPCEDGWEKLLTFLQKTEADDEELPLLTILESNGFNDALWALRAVEGFDKEIRLMACDFAESVVHLANDERSVNAIKVSRAYANGLATEEELNSAKDAAWAADSYASYSRSAARHAVKAAFEACNIDFDTVSDATCSAAAAVFYAAFYKNDAACSAIDAACSAIDARNAEEEKQKTIFKEYVK